MDYQDTFSTYCLQQAIAYQAFANAKAAGDVAGMTADLIYCALERNTGRVGLANVACTPLRLLILRLPLSSNIRTPPPLEPPPPTRLLPLNWPNKSPPLAVILKTPSNLALSLLATSTTTPEPATPAMSKTTPRTASSRRICS